MAVDRTDVMMFAISLDNSEFFTQTTVSESTQEGGGAGGGLGPGGGGGRTSMGSSMNSASNPYAPGGSLLLPYGSVIPNENSDLASDPPSGSRLDFEMPRLGLRAGRAIESYFSRVRPQGEIPFWGFDITTKLEDKALEQKDATLELNVLEEVAQDVLST